MIDNTHILHLVQGGETSYIKLIKNIKDPLSAAQELVAFANTEGGRILVGIDDKTGAVKGLSYADIQRISNLLVNAASEGVKPALTIKTERGLKSKAPANSPTTSRKRKFALAYAARETPFWLP